MKLKGFPFNPGIKSGARACVGLAFRDILHVQIKFDPLSFLEADSAVGTVESAFLRSGCVAILAYPVPWSLGTDIDVQSVLSLIGSLDPPIRYQIADTVDLSVRFVAAVGFIM